MVEIEQRFVGYGSLQAICNRLAPESQLSPVENMTGYLVRFGVVAAALKIRHVRPSDDVRFVLEIQERRGQLSDRYVVLTLDRDFIGLEALEAYLSFRSKNSTGQPFQ